MSFRMRGQAYCAARYAATWVLIVSMSSSAVVMGAPTRRAARKAKKNCCPQPATCSSCDECSSCQTGHIIAPATALPNVPHPSPPDPVPPDPKLRIPKSEIQIKVEAANTENPPSPDPGPSSPSPDSEFGVRNSSISKIQEASILYETRPTIVSEEAPPQPDFRKNESPNEATSTNVSSSKGTLSNATSDEIAPLSVEPPKPAGGGSKYQEYLDRYFDRKKAKPAASTEDTPALPQEESPTLSPMKPAKQYNDPFRPTSYRSSPVRTWLDSTGASRMKARFLGVDENGMAKMVREDGRTSRVPIANLSRDDVRYIELLAIHDTITSPSHVIAAKPRR